MNSILDPSRWLMDRTHRADGFNSASLPPPGHPSMSFNARDRLRPLICIEPTLPPAWPIDNRGAGGDNQEPRGGVDWRRRGPRRSHVTSGPMPPWRWLTNGFPSAGWPLCVTQVANTCPPLFLLVTFTPFSACHFLLPLPPLPPTSPDFLAAPRIQRPVCVAPMAAGFICILARPLRLINTGLHWEGHAPGAVAPGALLRQKDGRRRHQMGLRSHTTEIDAESTRGRSGGAGGGGGGGAYFSLLPIDCWSSDTENNQPLGRRRAPSTPSDGRRRRMETWRKILHPFLFIISIFF